MWIDRPAPLHARAIVQVPLKTSQLRATAKAYNKQNATPPRGARPQA
jgi:hypothetical protein